MKEKEKKGKYPKKFIEKAIWPVYVCTNSQCVNSVGDINYEEACGLDFSTAPKIIKCTSCHSDMKLSNTAKKK